MCPVNITYESTQPVLLLLIEMLNRLELVKSEYLLLFNPVGLFDTFDGLLILQFLSFCGCKGRETPQGLVKETLVVSPESFTACVDGQRSALGFG